MRKPITAATARRMANRNPMPASLADGFRDRGWADRLPQVYERAAGLFCEHLDASKALWTHLKQLLPMIAFYEEALRLCGSQQAALAFMDQWAFVKIERMMPRVRLLMKLGLYRWMPALCGVMLDRMFGESAGFAYRLVPDAPRFAADMTRCPYVEICAKYGVPELTRFACQADDITYGHLHPRLVWARTQTLGTGGECCDFRLHLKKEKS